jgi:hypothetical protein
MAKRKSADGASKSELIRDYLSLYPNQRAREVAAGLEAQGTVVNTGLVYQIRHALSQAKTKKADAGKMKRRAKASRRTEGPSAASNAAAPRGAKADAIREAAQAIGKRVRPRDVRAILAERGIAVTWAQIGSVLTSMGMRRRPRRNRAATPAAASTSIASARVSIDDLVAAKKVADQLGGINKLKEALSALARLSQ